MLTRIDSVRQNSSGEFGGISLSLDRAACYKILMATNLKIGFLGAGKMATALAKGFVRAEIVFPKEIIASDVGDSARNIFAKETGAKTIGVKFRRS